MKIATVVGARPQFIKAAALNRTLQKGISSVQEILIHTGQHYDSNMSEVFFQEMEIPRPHYHLGIGGCTHGAMTGRMLEALETLLIKEKPDWVLVYGDTNSTLAGALAAVKLHIPVAHVEAGLRSFNRKMPEEINRILTDQCSDLLFTPAINATQQLLQEGIPSHKIVQVGDIMYDSVLYYQQKAKACGKILEKLSLSNKGYALATIHRAENTDDDRRLEEIFFGLNAISERLPVILPLHPRTRKIIENLGWLEKFHEHFNVIEPVGYFDMLLLESHSKLILTDSGGVQKEAYFFKVPCLTLRDETEWVELVACGVNKLVFPDRNEMVKAFDEMVEIPFTCDMGIYGHGDASSKILQSLSK